MNKISKKSITLWQIRLAIITVFMTITATLLLKRYPAMQIFATVLLAVAFSLLSFLYCPLRCKNFCYQIENDTLCIKSGVIYKKEKYIPLDRVEQITFFATPIERILGLKSALIFTAGATTLVGSLDKNDEI